jgi:uncharacterized protein YndB with AHSA1/START domain
MSVQVPATRSVEHGTFRLERTYAATPARVFEAWANEAIKDRWFGSGDPDFLAVIDRYSLDFREGGREHLAGKVADGRTFSLDATYHQVLPDERIVYSYEIHVAGRRTSVSLVTIELAEAGMGTKLGLTEQGVFLDTKDTNALRRLGATDELDKLGRYLETVPTEG